MIPEHANAARRAPVAHTIMFWLLTGAAMAVFAPCVLVSIWIETEEILDHERAVAGVVAGLEAQVERNEIRIKALEEDPLLNERLLRRDLNRRMEGEQITQWPATELAALDVNLPEPTPGPDIEQPDLRPGWVVKLIRWLPAWPWRKLFAEYPSRLVMLAMAGGLLSAAFILFGPSPTRARLVPTDR